VPQIYKLAEECNVALRCPARPNDELRNQLVPINASIHRPNYWPPAGITSTGRMAQLTFEYVMLDGINDRPEHARQLHGAQRAAKLNLIPFNVFPGTRYRASAPQTILTSDILNDHGVIANIAGRARRHRRGLGQLAGRVTDRTLVRLGPR